MPPVGVAWKACLSALFFINFHCYSVFILLYLFFLSFLLIQPLFFPCMVSPVCVSTSGLLWGQLWQNNKDSGGSLDTHCIQFMHTQSPSTHTPPHTHTLKKSCADRSHPPQASPPRQSELHFTPWEYDGIPCRSHPGVVLHRPVAQEAQRKDDKLSIRPGSGEFSSCLHTLFEAQISSSTCGEHISFCFGCEEVLLFSAPSPLFPLCCFFFRNCNSAGKTRNLCPHSEVPVWLQLSSKV